MRELTLLGQNVNAYNGLDASGAPSSLAKLACSLAAVPGVDRIRYTTSHPNDMADDLIAAHGHLPQLAPYLHLPVQSGSDRVLRAMNRKHTAAHYLALVERIRAARPDIALTSDFIVGFPGETDADFEATLSLVRTVGYAAAFSFKYSPRPGTPAAALPGQVDEAVKDARLQALQALLLAQKAAFDALQVGRTLPVLFERVGRRPGQLIGKSPYLQSVVVEAPRSHMGEMIDVTITEAGPNSLRGVLHSAPEQAAA